MPRGVDLLWAEFSDQYRRAEGALVALQLSDRQDPLTEIVAKKIVEIAELDEHDPDRLRDRGLTRLR
jgi:hypothetical protein